MAGRRDLLARGGAGFEPYVTTRATYVVPLRWRGDGGRDELAAYLERVAQRLDVVVVDGSPPDVFAANAAAWGHFAKHVAPDADLHYLMGKVNGVITGLRIAARDGVVLADDDVLQAWVDRGVRYAKSLPPK